MAEYKLNDRVLVEGVIVDIDSEGGVACYIVSFEDSEEAKAWEHEIVGIAPKRKPKEPGIGGVVVDSAYGNYYQRLWNGNWKYLEAKPYGHDTVTVEIPWSDFDDEVEVVFEGIPSNE